ncbi:MAG: amino acid adenylation domain-containing protein [Bacteroidota bacterium]
MPADEASAVAVEQLQASLSQRLPAYMIPSVLVQMDHFPMTVSGKLDKRALPDPGVTSKSEYVAPETDLEKQLCALWAEVLRLDRVGVTDHFFRIGGDSIISIQLSGHIREIGYPCQVKDLFKHNTVRSLAYHLSTTTTQTTVLTEQGTLEGCFDLLPVQQWFFEQVDAGLFRKPGHWNQSFLIHVQELELSRLQQSLNELVNYHDLSRAVFVKDQQCYQPAVSIGEVPVLDVSQLSEEAIQEVLTKWQSDFTLLGESLLFSFGYLHGYEDGSARVFMALHHLIVDAVSWRILADDLQKLYHGESLPEKGSSYRQWVNRMKKYPAMHREESTYWSEQLVEKNPYGHLVTSTKRNNLAFKLNAQETKVLLQDASEAYHTEVNDLLLLSLFRALAAMSSKEQVSVTLEGHGRELLFDDIDHSRTLGWFTTMFPVTYQMTGDLSRDLVGIKENLRNVPHKGLGFGAFAVDEVADFGFGDLPPVTFNYLGQFEGAENTQWKVMTANSGESMSAHNEDRNILNINGWVYDSVLQFHVSSKLPEEDTDKFAALFQSSLTEVIHHCQKRVAEYGSWLTPSDVPFANVSRHLLDSLQDNAFEQENRVADVYAASSLQQGFVYHAISQPEDDAYRVQVLYDYQCELDIPMYLKAWEACIRMYPSLRMAFDWSEQVLQVIYEKGHLSIQHHDITHLQTQKERDAHIETIRQEDRQQPFDLSLPSLFRLHLIKQGEAHFTLLKSEHHSIADGWSGPVLMDQVHHQYDALMNEEVLPEELDTTYFETQRYVHEHKLIASKYWEDHLSGVESANEIGALLDTGKVADALRKVEKAGSVQLRVSGETYDRLKDFTKSTGVTVNTVVQFIWHKMLQVYSAASQTVVGTTISGRDLPIADIGNSVGLYINTLPLLIDWNNDATISEQLHQIQERLTAMNSHSFADLAKLQKGAERLFHSLLVFENFPSTEPSETSVASDVTFRSAVEKSDYPLSVIAYEHEEALHLFLRYDAALLCNKKADGHMQTLKYLIDQVVDQPEAKHQDICLLHKQEFQQIVYDWNETEVELLPHQTVQQLFEEQVASYPDRVAMVFEGEELTYGEMDKRCDQVARLIRSEYELRYHQPLASDTPIALFLDRGLDLIIGIMAILKAGGAYVPVDPVFPDARIDFVLEDTEASLILTDEKLSQERLQSISEERIILINAASTQLHLTQKAVSKPDLHGESLAYIIYTSGTTGKPKGTMITHGSVLHVVQSFGRQIAQNPVKRYLLYASTVFDASVVDIFTTLLNGSTLYIASEEERKEGQRLERLISKNQIDTASLPPVLLSTLALKPLQSLKTLIVAGEACPVETVVKWQKNRTLINGYGPTEATVCATMHHYDADDLATNIGRPIPNKKVYVLDKQRLPVPIGVTGELYIGGAGIAKGYLNREELTNERFIENPYASASDEEKGWNRLYKTGDLVRWLPEGDLEYIGRNDEQVKIRGYRIELGEVEAALTAINGVNQSAVIVKKQAENRYLVGYYVPEEGATLSESVLREIMSAALPDYMVPNAFVSMTSFPMTVSGKLDKRALPDPAVSQAIAYVAPVNELEVQLCETWAAVLGLERVGVTDNFFRIGGASIVSIQLSCLVRELGYPCH